MSVVAVLLLAGAGGCSGHPTPALPTDLCQVIGADTIARLAPDTGTPKHTSSSQGKFTLLAGCSSAGPALRNDLRVTVTRYGDCEEGEDGAVWCGSGTTKSRENFGLQCAGRKRNSPEIGVYSEPAGLGDRSCLSLRSRPREANAELLVAAGADQISVDYTGYDGRLTPAAASAGAQEVARALVAALATSG
jgi:hypothetical protein